MNNNQQPQIDVNSLPEFACECGGKQFEIVYEIRTVSQFYSPSGNTEYAPIQLFKCNSCGKIQYEIAGLKKPNDGEKENNKKNNQPGNEGDGIIRSLK